jgi:hypothetical protein
VRQRNNEGTLSLRGNESKYREKKQEIMVEINKYTHKEKDNKHYE